MGATPVLVAVRGRCLLFSDGTELRLPEAAGVQADGQRSWVLTVKGRTKGRDRRSVVTEGDSQREVASTAEYLRRCVRQECGEGQS